MDYDKLPVTYSVNTAATWNGKEAAWSGTKQLSGRQLYLVPKCNDCRIVVHSKMTVMLNWEGE
ncbi:hypothetical protein [Halobacillus faecis]